MNKAFFIGNLTRDPEQFETNNNKVGTNFDIAVNMRDDKVIYVRCTAWGALGEHCAEYLAKGRKVGVFGSVEAHAYITNDGEAAASLQIPFVENVEFCTPKEKKPEGRRARR